MVSRPETFSYSGNILADNSVNIGFGVSGRVTAMYVEEGQRVSKGQLLAAIETSTYQNALAVAGAGNGAGSGQFQPSQPALSKKVYRKEIILPQK